MNSEELNQILENISKQGEMDFRDGATKEQIGRRSAVWSGT